MSQILAKAWKPAIAIIALTGSLVVAGAAQAAHNGRRPCNPAAEAHMSTAIRLMATAGGKPIHVRKSLARAAVTHISLAQRFVRTPGARAELYGASAMLERSIHGHCALPLHGAIERTRLALDLERGLCACGRQACTGGCHALSPPRLHIGGGPHGPVRHGSAHGYPERDFQRPTSNYGYGLNSLAGRLGYARFAN